jgi:MFS family permease
MKSVEAKNGAKLSRNVYALGFVSMFNDMASKMIYPLIPEFLVSIGATHTLVGVVEGIAEATASVFRSVSGRISDKIRKRKLFIYLGYGLSTVVKPLLYLANSWTTVLGVRFSDRLGKAIRTPPRDALLSTSVDKTVKGKAFGVHRAMDRFGSVAGPLLALLVLTLTDNNIRLLFLFALVPGVISVFFINFAKETKGSAIKKQEGQKSTGLRDASFITFLISIIVFTLGNSSNAFLILKAREAGLTVGLIPVIWIVYNASCMIASPIFGSLSDRIGRIPVIVMSFIYYAIVYLLFGFATKTWMVWALFAAYGIHYGLSEGVFKAYVADLVEPENRGTAYGLFTTGIGVALLPASIIMGTVWDAFGSKWAFIVAAGLSTLGFLIFMTSLLIKRQR